MCWRTYNKPLKKLIAEENVPIFKVCIKDPRLDFSNTVESYFMSHCYQLETVYKLNRITPRDTNGYFEINAGFHSYLAGCLFRRVLNVVWILSPQPILWVCSYERDNTVKVSGYIPKGSEYYVNGNGECVSNSICLTKIEEL